MSKLYAMIAKSARKTQPTARGHSFVEVNCKNWEYRINCSIQDKGGGGGDTCTISITNIKDGSTSTVWNGSLADLATLSKIGKTAP